MAEAERALAVWCFGRRAGTLTDDRVAPTFAYDEAWLDGGMPPLSQSLPLDGAFAPEAAGAFFGGLLPEGVPRELLARRLSVSAGNDFALLAAVGGDTAGAISLQPLGQEPPRDGDVEWLDDDAFVQLIDELPTRPMHADEDGEYRLSLAGAQDKLPVVVGERGRIGLTKGHAPSTHILKTPIERLDGTVVNEAFCLALARLMGIDAAIAAPHRVGDREFLLVARYDRRHDGDGVTRLHQEDFCQALGIPAQRKYQSEGGPSLADCFALLRAAAAVPAREIVKLLDDVAMSFLVGSHDAHGKNYSLLYMPESGNAVLAPAYDVISTFAYQRTHNLSRKMAMSIGGEYRPDYVRPRHLSRLLDEAGLGAPAARRRLLGHAAAAPFRAAALRIGFQDAGWDAPVLDRIVALIEARASLLAEIAAPPPPVARRSTGPLAYQPRDDERDEVPHHLTTDLPRLRVGQQWRNLHPSPGAAATTLTIEGFGEDGTVTASIRPAGTTAAGTGVGPASSYSGYALLSDPEWKVHLVAAAIDHEAPEAARVIRIGGELQGARSHPPGGGSPESCFRIVAPTGREAIALVKAIVGDEIAVRAAPRWAEER